jgi:Xaa-Pro aminopeptidase
MLAREKVIQACEIAREVGLDAWVTFVRESAMVRDPVLELILGLDVTWQSVFVVSSSGRSVAIVGSLDAAAVRDVGAFDEVIPYVESIRPKLTEVLDEMQPSVIGMNYSEDSEIADGLTHGMYRLMRKYLQGTAHGERIRSAERLVAALRERKTAEEVRIMKEAVAITLEIFDRTRGFIKPGRTEKEIARFMTEQAAALNVGLAWGADHCPSVFTGPDTAGAHFGPTDRVVERGHVLNIDFGVKHRGYCSDLQRTFYVLREREKAAPPEVKRGFDTIVESIRRSGEALTVGRRGREIDAVARQYIIAAGYQEYPHALGHQVGRHAHDGAALLAPAWERYGTRPDLLVEAGQVYTLEPRLTIPGYGVATIEEEVLVTPTGREFLSYPQTDIYLIK